MSCFNTVIHVDVEVRRMREFTGHTSEMLWPDVSVLLRGMDSTSLRGEKFHLRCRCGLNTRTHTHTFTYGAVI